MPSQGNERKDSRPAEIVRVTNYSCALKGATILKVSRSLKEKT